MGIGPDYEPRYEVLADKKDVVKKLRQAAKEAETVYLAPDPDREGEAIAWHIAEILKDAKDIRRVTFNEITKGAVLKALANPRTIDLKKVDAQQARRVLDRLMGFRLSPLLWEKVKQGLSAGRVQSVALKMVCDRQAEIDAFKSEEYWNLGADLKAAVPPAFNARLQPDRRQEGRGRQRRGRGAHRPRPRGRQVRGRQGRAQGVAPEAAAAVHHQPPAAGGGAALRLLGQAHHGDRPGALRRQGDRRPRRDRPDHLHADRLHPRRRGGDHRRPRVHRRHLRAGRPAREAQRLQLEGGGAGRPRGDPPDQLRPAAGRRARLPQGRGVEALQADLGPLRRLPDAARPLRRHPGGHRERAATSCAPRARC